MTQTSGGNTVQSFQYDGHDKLTSGLGESEGYDANGNLKTQTVSGQTTIYTWDDEDRLTQMVTPSGTSSFTYNGLGLRTGKTDSTGTYAYVCDGTSPGSPVLADGLAVYTPGLSDHRGSTSTFSHDDLLGSLRFLTDSGQNVTANLLPDAFGETVSQMGSVLTPFAWNGASGYQSDSDGLKLLGHRYYDSRTGRFISQDPIGDGDNWYAYADNSPTNETDPLGLYVFIDPGLAGTSGDPSQFDHSGAEASGADGTWDNYQSDGKGGWTYLNTSVHGGLWDQMNNSAMGPGVPMLAGDHHSADGSKWYKSKSGDHDPPHVHRGKNGPRYNREGKEIKPNGDLKPGGGSVKKSQMDQFQKVFDDLNPPRPGAAAAAGESAGESAGVMGAEGAADALGPAGWLLGAGIAAWDVYNHPQHGQTTLTWTGPNDPRAGW